MSFKEMVDYFVQVLEAERIKGAAVEDATYKAIEEVGYVFYSDRMSKECPAHKIGSPCAWDHTQRGTCLQKPCSNFRDLNKVVAGPDSRVDPSQTVESEFIERVSNIQVGEHSCAYATKVLSELVNAAFEIRSRAMMATPR